MVLKIGKKIFIYNPVHNLMRFRNREYFRGHITRFTPKLIEIQFKRDKKDVLMLFFKDTLRGRGEFKDYKILPNDASTQQLYKYEQFMMSILIATNWLSDNVKYKITLNNFEQFLDLERESKSAFRKLRL